MKHQMAWIAVAACSALASAGAGAQVAGSWLVRGGATHIAPQVTSGSLTTPSFPNGQADVKSDTQVSLGLTYMLTDHVSIDVPMAPPFKYEIVGAGSIAGIGKIGEAKSLPFTAYAQYRFMEPAARWRPYAGMGLTYAKFFKERTTAALTALTGGTPANPTTMSTANRFGISPMVGFTYAIDGKWFFDAAYTKTFVKTKTTLSTGQQIATRLDPNTFCVGVGMRF